MNKGFITGRLTADPELKISSNGTPVLSFTLAHNWSKDQAEFIPFTAFDKTAEGISTWFKKGHGIELEYHLMTKTFEKGDVKVKSISAIVDKWSFSVGVARGEGNKSPSIQAEEKPRNSQPKEAPIQKDLFTDIQDIASDDDLPF